MPNKLSEQNLKNMKEFVYLGSDLSCNKKAELCCAQNIARSEGSVSKWLDAKLQTRSVWFTVYYRWSIVTNPLAPFLTMMSYRQKNVVFTYTTL